MKGLKAYSGFVLMVTALFCILGALLAQSWLHSICVAMLLLLLTGLCSWLWRATCDKSASRILLAMMLLSNGAMVMETGFFYANACAERMALLWLLFAVQWLFVFLGLIELPFWQGAAFAGKSSAISWETGYNLSQALTGGLLLIVAAPVCLALGLLGQAGFTRVGLVAGVVGYVCLAIIIVVVFVASLYVKTVMLLRGAACGSARTRRTMAADMLRAVALLSLAGVVGIVTYVFKTDPIFAMSQGQYVLAAGGLAFMTACLAVRAIVLYGLRKFEPDKKGR